MSESKGEETGTPKPTETHVDKDGSESKKLTSDEVANGTDRNNADQAAFEASAETESNKPTEILSSPSNSLQKEIPQSKDDAPIISKPSGSTVKKNGDGNEAATADNVEVVQTAASHEDGAIGEIQGGQSMETSLVNSDEPVAHQILEKQHTTIDSDKGVQDTDNKVTRKNGDRSKTLDSKEPASGGNTESTSSFSKKTKDATPQKTATTTRDKEARTELVDRKMLRFKSETSEQLKMEIAQYIKSIINTSLECFKLETEKITLKVVPYVNSIIATSVESLTLDNQESEVSKMGKVEDARVQTALTKIDHVKSDRKELAPSETANETFQYELNSRSKVGEDASSQSIGYETEDFFPDIQDKSQHGDSGQERHERPKKETSGKKDFRHLPPLTLYRPAKFEPHNTAETYIPVPPIRQLPYYPKLAFPRKWGVPLVPVEPRTVLVGFTCPPVHRFRHEQLMTHPASTLQRYYNKPCIKAIEWIKVSGRR